MVDLPTSCVPSNTKYSPYSSEFFIVCFIVCYVRLRRYYHPSSRLLEILPYLHYDTMQEPLYLWDRLMVLYLLSVDTMI